MARDIPESDWKLLRRLHPVALERYCARVLGETRQIADDPRRSAHEATSRPSGC